LYSKPRDLNLGAHSGSGSLEGPSHCWQAVCYCKTHKGIQIRGRERVAQPAAVDVVAVIVIVIVIVVAVAVAISVLAAIVEWHMNLAYHIYICIARICESFHCVEDSRKMPTLSVPYEKYVSAS